MLNITVLMIVFNEEKMLDICLSKLIDHVQNIVVVEGSIEQFRHLANSEGGSSDRTWQILNDWQGNHNNIHLVRGKWKDKHEMQEAGLKLIPHGTDYLMIVDADEHYDFKDIENIRKELEEEKPDIGKVKFEHWGIGGGRHTASLFGLPIARLFRWVNGFKFVPKTMNCVHAQEMYGHDHCIILDATCRHYGHIDPEKVDMKNKFYKERTEAWKQ